MLMCMRTDIYITCIRMWLFIYAYGAEGNTQSSFNVVYVMDWGAFSGIHFSRLLCLDLRNVNVKINQEVLLA